MSEPKTFCSAFKDARQRSGKTYREIAADVGLTISRLCDIEAGRFYPPSEGMAKKLEKSLGVSDGHLVQLANAERQSMPHNIIAALSARPILAELVVWLAQKPDDEIAELKEKLDLDEKNN